MISKTKTTTLDVRQDIRSGRQPLGKIRDALNGLRPDENLRLLAPFEPVPLFVLAAAKGFEYLATQLPDGDWEVIFSLASETGSIPNTSPVTSEILHAREAQGEIIDVDARGLEPPQPMVRILETLTRLPRGAKLSAHTDRRPVHLYSHLEERGFVGESEEQKDGSFITHIRPA
jgi:uncharacterized protein (DUF2249 family)